MSIENLTQALKELRLRVENVNQQPAIALSGATFKGANSVQTLSDGNWVFGYKVEIGTLICKRSLFIKVKDYKFSEIPEDQKDEMMLTCFDVFFDQGEKIPEETPLSPNSILIEQEFMPGFWYERNPNIIVPGKPN